MIQENKPRILNIVDNRWWSGTAYFAIHTTKALHDAGITSAIVGDHRTLAIQKAKELDLNVLSGFNPRTVSPLKYFSELSGLLDLIEKGGGDDEARLIDDVNRLGLSGIVKFLGHRNDVDQILPDADLQVHPSLSEGMPNAILEGLANAIPIIASSIPGIKEIDMDKKVIEFVQPGNPDELAELFLKLKSDSSFRNNLGQRGREHVRKYFSLDRMILGAESIFKDSYISGKIK